MVEHKCEKCGRIFDRKDRWRYHINRKFSCIEEPSENEKLKKQIDELTKKIDQLLLNQTNI